MDAEATSPMSDRDKYSERHREDDWERQERQNRRNRKGKSKKHKRSKRHKSNQDEWNEEFATWDD